MRYIVTAIILVVIGALSGSIVDQVNPRIMSAQIAAEHNRNEHACLREALYYEARGEPVGEQIMVGMVILARAADRDPQWPKTICKVIDQPRQFSYRWDNSVLFRPIDPAAWERSHFLARRIMDEAWKTQFMPSGAECVRSYKMSDKKLASLKPEHIAQLKVSKRSLNYFARTQVPVFTLKTHTFYKSKKDCVTKMPTISV